MAIALSEFEGVGVPVYLWYSVTQAAWWSRLPVALVDGVKRSYTSCESTKEEGATKPKGYGFDDWRYIGKGTLVHGGVWRDELRKKKIPAAAGGYE